MPKAKRAVFYWGAEGALMILEKAGSTERSYLAGTASGRLRVNERPVYASRQEARQRLTQLEVNEGGQS